MWCALYFVRTLTCRAAARRRRALLLLSSTEHTALRVLDLLVETIGPEHNGRDLPWRREGSRLNSSCSTGYPPYSAGIWPLCMQQGDATTRGQFWDGGNVSAGAWRCDRRFVNENAAFFAFLY